MNYIKSFFTKTPVKEVKEQVKEQVKKVKLSRQNLPIFHITDNLDVTPIGNLNDDNVKIIVNSKKYVPSKETNYYKINIEEDDFSLNDEFMSKIEEIHNQNPEKLLDLWINEKNIIIVYERNYKRKAYQTN
jgi:hypothetical protein